MNPCDENQQNPWGVTSKLNTFFDFSLICNKFEVLFSQNCQRMISTIYNHKLVLSSPSHLKYIFVQLGHLNAGLKISDKLFGSNLLEVKKIVGFHVYCCFLNLHVQPHRMVCYKTCQPLAVASRFSIKW